MSAGGQTPVSCEAGIHFRLPSHLSGPSRGFCEVLLSDQVGLHDIGKEHSRQQVPVGVFPGTWAAGISPCPYLPLWASLFDHNGARVLRRTRDRATGAPRTAFQPTQMSKAYTQEAWGRERDQLLSLGGVFKRWDQHTEKCMVT